MSTATRIRNGAMALVALGAFGFLINAALVQPAAEWKQSVFQSRTDTLEKTAALRDSIARLEIEKAALSQDEDSGMIWPAQQMGEATARVQSEISAAASANRVSLRSITPTATRDLPMAEAVSFRIEAEARLDALNDFLLALEYNTPALLIDQAILRRLNKVGDSGEQPLLFTQLIITAPVQGVSDGEGRP